MDKNQIQEHIRRRENEMKLHKLYWEYCEKLNTDVGLSESTYNEIKAKISSKIVQCQKSINDHKQLLEIE